MVELRRWTCIYCGQDVIEGQRFVWVPGKGYAHIECAYERASKRLDRDVVALMDANEVLVYAIVRLKEAARLAASEEVAGEIVAVRKKIESLATKLEKVLVDKYLERE